MECITIHPADNVAVLLQAEGDIPAGHKIALRRINLDEQVIKYGFPIGRAKMAIEKGEWVHTHNVRTCLDEKVSYEYSPKAIPKAQPFSGSFDGYLRPDGRVGIRNELWIIPTVGCVNKTCERLAQLANEKYQGVMDGVFAFPHPYGCSQMGEDMIRTQQLLAALTHNPNAGGVLIVSLGCENNHLGAFRPLLGEVDEARVQFLVAQDEQDEIEAGLQKIEQIVAVMANDIREKQPLGKLVIGLKCGGSDGFSGITANPLLGAFSDRLIAAGGTGILSEVPEMFGAETMLFDRCKDEPTFEKAVQMIDGFKQYFIDHGQVVYENPSPGNKQGGITTLEEKSLGCTQKGGTSAVIDVISYAEPVEGMGLHLLYGPGNDGCAITAFAASGAQIILFTTGRGTPMGAPVPTIKVSTNSELAKRKPVWIDFDAGKLLDGLSIDEAAEQLKELVLAVASGQKAKNELNGYKEIVIFKDGVTL